MTEQQNHLKSVIDQQRTLLNEIQDLNNQLNIKRDMATKLQGIYEYLTGIGIKLPEQDISFSEKPDEINSEENLEETK